MSWTRLEDLTDLGGVPKLGHLAAARRAGLRVPPTYGAWAREVSWAAPPPLPGALLAGPVILRSASPSEDTHETSNAGQLVSRNLPDPADGAAYLEAFRAVLDALPRDRLGRPAGLVFAQPMLTGGVGGVAFTDGFYFERAEAPGGNQALTAGEDRGTVTRGHLSREGAACRWLAGVHAALPRARGAGGAIDVEYHRAHAGAFTLLQARPALFPLRRNPLLSIANHRETMGEVPRPLMASVLATAGPRCPAWYAPVIPEVATWDETYTVEFAGRAWMNFSFFFRVMDRFGLPRRWVMEGVGGDLGGAEGGRLNPGRFLVSIPRLVQLQAYSWLTAWRAPRVLAAFDARLEGAAELPELYAVAVEAMTAAIMSNFGIGAAFTGAYKLRTALGLRGAARPPTLEMMEAYEGLRRLPPAARGPGLDAWLARFGHRGPMESDLSRPRFDELRPVLAADLGAGERPVRASGATSGGAGAGGGSAAERGGVGTPGAPGRGTGSRRGGDRPGVLAALGARLSAPLYWIDHRREWFRDQWMHRWRRLRRRLLAAGGRLVLAGRLDEAADVFWLRGEDLGAEDLRGVVRTRRAEHREHEALALPDTATLDELTAARAGAAGAGPGAAAPGVYPAIALSDEGFEGPVVRADDLTTLLGRSGALHPGCVLVVPTLEPSWAVVFGRVGAVVAEVGGELSHASILLREAGKPAMVNARGVFAGVREGSRVRLEPSAGVVRRLDDAESGPAPDPDPDPDTGP